jgi:hypothetical protein
VLTPCTVSRVAGMAWLGNAYAVRKRFARNGGPFSFALVDLAIFARYVPTTARSVPAAPARRCRASRPRLGFKASVRPRRGTHFCGACENAKRMRLT